MQNARIDVSFKFTRPENHPYSRKGVTFAVHPVDFTFPGEAGCEPPTLDLARRWRTNFIRESDSIHHSPEMSQPATASISLSLFDIPESFGITKTNFRLIPKSGTHRWITFGKGQMLYLSGSTCSPLNAHI